MSICSDISDEINSRTSNIPILTAAKDLADANVDLAYADWQNCISMQSAAANAVLDNSNALLALDAAFSMNGCP